MSDLQLYLAYSIFEILDKLTKPEYRIHKGFIPSMDTISSTLDSFGKTQICTDYDGQSRFIVKVVDSHTNEVVMESYGGVSKVLLDCYDYIKVEYWTDINRVI